jgi:hypothetical protein
MQVAPRAQQDEGRLPEGTREVCVDRDHQVEIVDCRGGLG